MALCFRTSDALAVNLQSQSFCAKAAVASNLGCCEGAPTQAWSKAKWALIRGGHCGRLPCRVDYHKVESLQGCRNWSCALGKERLRLRWQSQAASCRPPLIETAGDMRAEQKASASRFLDTGPTIAPCSANLVARKRKSDLKRLAASAALQAGWNVFLPQQYTYSTDLKDVDPQQVRGMHVSWAPKLVVVTTLGPKKGLNFPQAPHVCTCWRHILLAPYSFLLSTDFAPARCGHSFAPATSCPNRKAPSQPS